MLGLTKESLIKKREIGKGYEAVSVENMLAAMRLEMSAKVPRTEYSAHKHWKLIERVTGIRVDENSSEEEYQRASSAFVKAWDYAMMWGVCIYKDIFGDKRTDMGHAVFSAGGKDFSTETFQLFEDPEDVYDYDMFAEYGTPDVAAITRFCNRHFENQNRLFPTCMNMTGIYVTCISGLLELMGWDTFLMAAGVDKEAFGEFVNRYCQWIQYYFEGLANTDSPVIMVHDDIVWGNGPFLAPEFYRQYVFPNYKKMFQPLKDAGKKILYTSDGNYTAFIDDIAGCGVNGFVMEPCTDMAQIAEKYGKTHVFVGNADTSILLSGNREAIENEVRRCMEIGKNCPGFVMAVGNHIPANTPVENALIYNEIYEKLARR